MKSLSLTHLLWMIVTAIIITMGWIGYETVIQNRLLSSQTALMQSRSDLQTLQQRWKSTSSLQTVTATLTSHPKLIKNENKGNRWHWEYQGLDGYDVDKILSELLNHPYVIKSLTLSRQNDMTATLSVEVEQ